MLRGYLHVNLFGPFTLAITESGKSVQHSIITRGPHMNNLYMHLKIKSSLLSLDIAFVNKSARFVAVSSLATLTVPPTTASQQR